MILLKPGVDSLFKKINCDKSAISDMLGGVAGVTEGNMMQVGLYYTVAAGIKLILSSRVLVKLY